MDDKKLISYIQGKANQKIREEVLDWLKQPGSRDDLDKLVDRYLENPGWDDKDETDYQKLLAKIHGEIQRGERKADRRESWYPTSLLKIAASLLLLGLGILYLMGGDRPGTTEPVADVAEVALITKKTDVGEKLTLTMVDGTLITLNSLSRISFSAGYGKSDRVVILEGEAYFQIAPDEARPFRVEIGSVVTTALGTAFNAFSREGQIKIALTEGKVSVASEGQTVRLTRGEMVRLNRADQAPELSVVPFDEASTVAWKDGRIVFDRKPLKEIIKDLEEWYGVRIEVEEGVNLNRKVIGEFNNRSLKDILTGLDFSMSLTHKITGDQVTIKPSQPM